MRLAPNPWGPYGPSQDVFPIPPDMREAGAFCYAAKVHTELSRSDGEFVFTYNCNTPGIPPLLDLPQIYIPHPVRCTVAPGLRSGAQ